MRLSRLPAPTLPIAAGLLLVWSIRRALRAVGESLVPLLTGSRNASAFAPLLSLVPAALVALLARWIWRRSARDRQARWLAGGVIVAALGASYLTSGEVSGRGDFHGLLTPAPNSVEVETRGAGPSVRYAINAQGFRGPDLAIEKPKGTFRIAVVGGSFVFGVGVAEEDTLAAALGAKLRERAPSRPIEVMNLGISGDGLVSHRRVVELAQGTLDADLTVLGLMLPLELLPRDGQAERRGPFEVDAFHVVSWAVGMQTARFLWDAGDERSFSPARLALLREQVDALRTFRAARGEHPLLVLGYEVIPEPALTLLASLPGARVLPPLPRGGEPLFFPGDGHPTPAGNRAFAAVIADALIASGALTPARP